MHDHLTYRGPPITVTRYIQDRKAIYRTSNKQGFNISWEQEGFISEHQSEQMDGGI